MATSIKGMEIYIASDLHDYGRRDDGTPFIGEVYYLVLTNDRGDRWEHFARFHGVRVDNSSFEDYTSFLDIREESAARAQRLLDRILVAGEVDLQYWSLGRPVYGSDAYVEYGADRDLLLEREEG